MLRRNWVAQCKFGFWVIFDATVQQYEAAPFRNTPRADIRFQRIICREGPGAELMHRNKRRAGLQ